MSDLDFVTWLLVAAVGAFGVMVLAELLGRPPGDRDRARRSRRANRGRG